MRPFEPVAIVAEACLLPGAESPAALWDIVRNRRIVLREVHPSALGLHPGGLAGRKFIAGCVDVASNGAYDLPAIPGLDVDAAGPVHRWPLLLAWRAWSCMRSAPPPPDRRGVFLANLCYPSRAKVDRALDIWRDGATQRPLTDALNSGLPAQLVARLIDARGPAFALDAACASSLYALEIACRKLARRDIDMALVGAVNAADNLILQIGFEALKALSPTGQSRPFVQGADGLVPAEGAAAVVLKRLADVGPDDDVRGVIRGIGLSNDGRRKGFLAPDAGGQAEAMQRAYAMAGIDPGTVDYLECHATGTPVGDGVEVQSSLRVFRPERALPIGSLKANTGHLITVAGLASLLKLTQAMANEILPPTPVGGPLIPVLSGTSLTPLTDPCAWERTGGRPRRAAISNFGFGGNNSHLLLEAYEPLRGYVNGAPSVTDSDADDIVVVGIGLQAGPDRGERAVLRRLMNAPADAPPHASEAGGDPVRTRIPPADLLRAETPHLAMLDVAQMALEGVSRPAAERCGVFAGLQCSNESARWPIRERIKSIRVAEGRNDPDTALDDIAPPLEAADVLGAMANMAANRITSGEDFRGQGFAVAAESLSGLAALDTAMLALAEGALDLAVVTSAGFSDAETPESGDQDRAAALVLKRRKDAEAAGDRIAGRIGPVAWGSACSAAMGAFAEDLFSIGVALSLAARRHTLTSVGACVALGGPPQELTIAATSDMAGAMASVAVLPAPATPSPDLIRPVPHLFHAAAPDRQTLAARLRGGETGGEGVCRIALLSADADSLAAARLSAAAVLEADGSPDGPGAWYGEGAPDGELAFAFTGSAASYPRMGRGLLMAFPEVAESLGQIPRAQAMTPLLAKAALSEFEQLCAVALVSQAHAILLRDYLGIKPTAAIGLSLGESSALFAFGFWKDMGSLLDDIKAAAMYERHIGGAFETAGEAWGPNVPADWTNWRVRAPIEQVRAECRRTRNVEITIIYTDDDCMIGGPAEACRALCQRLGKGSGTLMHQHLVVHAEAMKPFEAQWRALHTRPVSRVPGVRLYTNAINAAYTPSKAKVADMLTRQAVATVDFPKTVRQAWQDGVRTFVELGPRDTLTQSIGQILKGKAHLAVATDRVETAELVQVAELAARLFAAGHSVKIDWIASRLDMARRHPWAAAAPYKVKRAARPPAPVIPGSMSAGVLMPVAPPLPAPVYPRGPAAAQPAGSGAFPPPPGQHRREPAPAAELSGLKPLKVRTPTGKAWSRPEIEASARGPMSDFFGPRFEAQDAHARNVRLPAAPLLLVDRITGIDAEAGVEAAGVIWTETDLKAGDWIMHGDRIRPGPLIECGQADLTLIGWMGADLRNRGERVYRLLGCEITFHEGGLPRAGETLRFQIEITQHATFAGVRMFFFQYDCVVDGRTAFSVRQGQAGFFTDAELASGKGVAWDPSTAAPPTANAAAPDTTRASRKRRFDRDDVAAFRAGDALACFGEGFETCAAHSFPPHLPGGRLSFFDQVETFDPGGGPWRRGYLKARARVAKDAWFYDGHFHNDPCMPGTLMAEAAVQALEFHAAAMGLTQDRDGYVFEPVPGETAKFICRGQVVPDTDHEVTYEVFIDAIIDGETPQIYGALLASCDGRKVFHCPRFGIQLRRNWPAPRKTAQPLRIGPQQESRGDEAALLDCANGPPSAAFGAMYERFDTGGRVPRLPQPPYHVMTRIIDVTTRPGVAQVGATIRSAYNVPADAWYFADNRSGAMPFAVLNEIVLQPCGWLASHCGFALEGGDRFRNLEGDGRILRAVGPQDGTIEVQSTLTRFSKVGPMTIVAFDVRAALQCGEPVMTLNTRFGFFPAAALMRQAGLPVTPGDRNLLALPASARDLTRPDHRLATGRLAMLDRIDYFDPSGGSAGLGIIRARQRVDPHAWYFKAHFFNDPVQPGSLGLDAMQQLLMRALLLKLAPDDLAGAIAETPATGEQIKWSYRGQVTPDKKMVTTIAEILSLDIGPERIVVTARASLWCDGLRIYEAHPISLAFRKPA